MSGWFSADADPAPPQGWVTVARFGSPLEAQIARGVLESAGIQTALAGEATNNLLQVPFRVSIQVPEADVDCAREMLDASADPADAPPS